MHDRRPPKLITLEIGSSESLIYGEQEGKRALKWTRLTCMRFADDAVRLQLHALAYNLASFLRTVATSAVIATLSLTSLRERVIKAGTRLARHARYAIFQLTEAALPRAVFARHPRLDQRPTRATCRGELRIAGGGRRPGTSDQIDREGVPESRLRGALQRQISAGCLYLGYRSPIRALAAPFPPRTPIPLALPYRRRCQMGNVG